MIAKEGIIRQKTEFVQKRERKRPYLIKSKETNNFTRASLENTIFNLLNKFLLTPFFEESFQELFL